MSELTPELVAQMQPVCEENAEEIAAALTRGIDAEVTVTLGEQDTYDRESPPEGFAGPGLLMMMQFGDVAMAAALPETSGLTRGWMHEPDITGEGMLNTLAQELSMLVVPETMMAGKFGASWVDDLSKSLVDGEVDDEATLYPLVLTEAGGTPVHLSMIWPCSQPEKLLPKPKPKAPAPEPKKEEATAPPPPPKRPGSMEELPPYARHLLKISVPVSVQLVTKKMSVQELLELAPGAMISFEKACDDALELTVRDNVIARGTTVKVGERFGLEIEEMTMPVEHFWTVRKSG
ncbi:FliM/FliN family flagellar motor C-terminal domain-containing protein [Aeoliella sp. ICT_H6.2]|uniref:FliM/FliN family flagellar motor C-terminal domain-containing protein n=1 Tax=Aeoliella straminimaris TaxID=2954799 RepID=A0A9X2FCG3_9BACT|nr:FliM/FliN family flagellar motor C-terminal domain-containing protein [Aeoliella straminimaris]MCO6046029.1 FliM/FliN family flagellar motor C-terminal domain-containing protein [Aeoliella straminimaris]